MVQQRHEVGSPAGSCRPPGTPSARCRAAPACAPRSSPDAPRDRPANTRAWPRSRRSRRARRRRPSAPSPRTASRPSGGKAGGRVADAPAARCAPDARCAKASATVPPKPLPISTASLPMPNSWKPSSMHGDIGIHQRQHRRLRAVKARQIERGDAVLCGERRQHRIEGVTVGQQRMQHDDVGPGAGAHRRERAVAGGRVLQICISVSPAPRQCRNGGD